jgi:hypothetical protein
MIHTSVQGENKSMFFYALTANAHSSIKSPVLFLLRGGPGRSTAEISFEKVAFKWRLKVARGAGNIDFSTRVKNNMYSI